MTGVVVAVVGVADVVVVVVIGIVFCLLLLCCCCVVVIAALCHFSLLHTVLNERLCDIEPNVDMCCCQQLIKVLEPSKSWKTA